MCNFNCSTINQKQNLDERPKIDNDNSLGFSRFVTLNSSVSLQSNQVKEQKVAEKKGEKENKKSSQD